MEAQEKRITVNDVTLRVFEEGNGPAVLLLHGFPDSAYLWRKQVPDLVKAGYRVIVPDQRGFGESDKPEGVEAYLMSHLADDMIKLLDELGVEETHVAGHDWGSVVAWTMAMLYPKRIQNLIALSVGHPSIFSDFTTDQLEKSWYIFLFQFKDVAEKMLMKDDWKLFKMWSRHHDESEKWIADMSRPGALSAALNWYRANFSPQALPNMPLPTPSIEVPTMGIWSTGDVLLTEEQMKRSGEKVAAKWRYEKVEASHWIPLDEPEELTKLFLDFFNNRS